MVCQVDIHSLFIINYSLLTIHQNAQTSILKSTMEKPGNDKLRG